MLARLPDSWLDELRDRCDIVDVVGSYVQLKQNGRRFWGRCPFHNEKTPSFSVDSQAQLYYCFGCHKGGTVINFMMEIEHMEFIDAVKNLAERVRFELPDGYSSDNAGNISRELKDKLFEANRQAALYYNRVLYQPQGAEALEYLHSRGLDDSIIRRFGLGSTGINGEGLIDQLREQGFSQDVLKQAWLMGERDGRVYDQFRRRVMFPIVSAQGRVLGFGGRVLGKGEPKYMNTSDTPVFNKRRELYGLNLVRKQKPQHVILVEGYMDVVALVQQGVEGVVATLGTALTEQQARLISHYSKHVFVAYDGDEAGQKAIERAIEIFNGRDIELNILRFPGGQDPDEFIRGHGRDAFYQLTPLSPVRWRLERLEARLDMSTQAGRTEYAIQAAKLIAALPNPVERENFMPELIIKTGFTEAALRAQIGASPQQQQLANPRPAYARTEDSRLPGGAEVPLSKHIKAERWLIQLLMHGLMSENMKNMLAPDDFADEQNRMIVTRLMAGEKPAAIFDSLPEQQQAVAAAIFNVDVPAMDENAEQLAYESMLTMRRARLQRSREEKLKRIGTLSATQGSDKALLLREILGLERELQKMNNS